MKKLLLLSSVALLFSATQSNAQIVYHDVIPDATLTNTHSPADSIDMDNNGVKDFVISLQNYTSSGITYQVAIVIPASPNNAVDTSLSSVPGFKTSIAHNLNDPINTSNSWAYGAAVSYQLLGGTATGFGAAGNFIGMSNKYIAVRFKIGSLWHFGWIRVSLNSSGTSLTLHDWAYNATSDASLLAGATVSSVEENSMAANYSIIATEKNISITSKNNFEKATVRITNLAGQLVFTTQLINDVTSVSMEGKADGIYFVTIDNGSNYFTKKIVVK